MTKMRLSGTHPGNHFPGWLGSRKVVPEAVLGTPENRFRNRFPGVPWKPVKTGFFQKAVFSASDEKEPHSYKGISAAFSFVAGLVQNAI
jgi:hypothetical protein